MMNEARCAAILLLLAVVSTTTAHTYMDEKRGAVENLLDIERKVIAQMMADKIAEMQTKNKGNGIYVPKNDVQDLGTGGALEKAKQRQRLLKGEKPFIEDKGGLSFDDRFLDTTLMNAMGIDGGRTYLFQTPQYIGGLRGRDITHSKAGFPELHAEQRTRALNSRDRDLHIWINKTPCPSCAAHLMRTYRNVKQHEKPTFHVASFYYHPIGNTVRNIDEALRCLAKMSIEGISIRPWDWNTFKNDFWKAPDKKFISDMQQTEKFKAGQKELDAILGQVLVLVNHNRNKPNVYRKWCNY